MLLRRKRSDGERSRSIREIASVRVNHFFFLFFVIIRDVRVSSSLRLRKQSYSLRVCFVLARNSLIRNCLPRSLVMIVRLCNDFYVKKIKNVQAISMKITATGAEDGRGNDLTDVTRRAKQAFCGGKESGEIKTVPS